MADILKVNNLAADPNFLKLAPEEQKSILSGLMGGEPQPQVSKSSFKDGLPHGVSMMGPSNQERISDESIDLLRPLAAGTGAALGTAVLPGIGTAAGYTGADLLMQKLKKEQQPIGKQLVSTALQATVGKLFNAGGKIVGAVRNADQPEIMKFLPTTSQGLEANGFSKTAGAAKFLEDTFATNAKKEALSKSGINIGDLWDRLSGKVASRNPVTVQDHQQMVKLITGEMVPESELQPISIKPKTAAFQPIKITPDEVDYQPIKFTPDSQRTTPFQSTNTAVTGQVEKVPSGTFSTRVTGPIQQEVVPGAYEVLPGVVKKVPFATDTASLDKLIGNSDRLQDALTRSQQAGLGVNAKEDLAAFWMSRIRQAATNEHGEVDGQMLKNLFDDPEMASSKKILFKNSSQTVSNISQFFKNAAFVQDKMGTSQAIKRGMLYGDGFLLSASTIYSAVKGNLLGPAISSGMIGMQIGAGALIKLLTKPETARFMIRMAGAEPLGMSDQFAAKVILRGLQGTTNFIVDTNGGKHPVTIQKDGQMVPVGQ